MRLILLLLLLLPVTPLPLTPTTRSIISYTSSLISYKCAEPLLLNATLNLPTPPKINLNCRGLLENHLVKTSTSKDIVNEFLSSLSLATNLPASEACKYLSTSKKLHLKSTTFTPPKRSLIGVIDGYDVALLRDR